MLSDREICHKFDVEPFSGNLFRVDPPNRTIPTIVKQTDDQCNVWRSSVENQTIPENVKRAHRQIVNVAKSFPESVHLLLDRIQPHSDLKRAAKCETN